MQAADGATTDGLRDPSSVTGSQLPTSLRLDGAAERHPPGRVLVLGGAGFVGSATVRAFIASGASVTALVRGLPTADRADALIGAEIIVGDAEDPALLATLLDRTDHVVYAVGWSHPGASNLNPVDTVFLTLPGLISLLEALRIRPAVGLSFLSSGGAVYGNAAMQPVHEDVECEPISAYGVMKLAAEKWIGMYALLYGLKTRVLRVANAYGPTQDATSGQGVVATLIGAAREDEPVPLYGDGGNVRDYVHVADVADVVVRLAEYTGGPRVVNVGSGVGLSVVDVLEIVEHVTGRRLRAERLPGRDFDVRRVVLDISRLRSLIDWAPISMEDGIASLWADRATVPFGP